MNKGRKILLRLLMKEERPILEKRLGPREERRKRVLNSCEQCASPFMVSGLRLKVSILKDPKIGKGNLE